MNSISIKGNLGEDPKINYVGGKQTAVVNVSMAVSEYKGKDPEGKSKYDTFWVRLVLWGRLAETAAKNLKKGDTVVVSGKLSVRNYETKEGEKRTSTEIVADDFSKSERLDYSGASGSRNQNGDEPLFQDGPDDDGFQ